MKFIINTLLVLLISIMFHAQETKTTTKNILNKDTRSVKKINTHITKKVADTLAELFNKTFAKAVAQLPPPITPILFAIMLPKVLLLLYLVQLLPFWFSYEIHKLLDAIYWHLLLLNLQ